jgi:catechol 2,3-dioxygenase-like lactoylglutathione lyase family enzyme
VQVKRLAWLGTRTEKFDETTAFFRDVLGIPMVFEEPGFAMLQLPGADRDFVEVFASDYPSAASYSTGPVVGLLVDDIEVARAELDAAGVELIGSTEWLQNMDGYGWFHVRGPDGNVYAIMQDSRLQTG